MKYFSFFGKKKKGNIHFEDRGETLAYEEKGEVLYCSCTWINGLRIYTESIINWRGKDGYLSAEERCRIAKNILSECKDETDKIFIVINEKDIGASLFEDLIYDNDLWDMCIGVEYIGQESKRKVYESRVEKLLASGEKCEINGNEIKTINDFRKVTRHMKL